MKLVLPALLLVLLVSSSFAAGFLSPGTALTPQSDSLLASWNSPPQPDDYSGSRDRIILELAQMQLFGRTPESPVGNAPTENVDVPLRLVAIARLDGRPVALIDEGKPLPVRLSVGQPTETGWKVTAITNEQVTLQKENTERTLDLFPSGN